MRRAPPNRCRRRPASPPPARSPPARARTTSRRSADRRPSPPAPRPSRASRSRPIGHCSPDERSYRLIGMLTGRSPSGATNWAKRSWSTSSTTSKDTPVSTSASSANASGPFDLQHGVERLQHAGVARVGVRRRGDLDDAAARAVGFDREHGDRRQPAVLVDRSHQRGRCVGQALHRQVDAARSPVDRPSESASVATPTTLRATAAINASTVAPSAIHVPRLRRDRIALMHVTPIPYRPRSTGSRRARGR